MVALKENREAANYFQRAVELDLRNMVARINHGIVLVTLGRWDQAIAQLAPVVRAEPKRLYAPAPTSHSRSPVAANMMKRLENCDKSSKSILALASPRTRFERSKRKNRDLARLHLFLPGSLTNSLKATNFSTNNNHGRLLLIG